MPSARISVRLATTSLIRHQLNDAAQGFVNERGKLYAAKSVASMLR